LTEEFSLFGKLLLGGELARKCVKEERDNHVSQVFNVVDEHDITELLFHVVIATLGR